MGQQRIPTIKNVCHRIPLMLPQGNLRVHPAEADMLPIIFSGPCAVEQFIVLCDQRFPPHWVMPNPFLKSILDGLLLLLGQRGFLLIQHPPFCTIRIQHGVINAHISQVQGIL